MAQAALIRTITRSLTQIISETNGLGLYDTLELLKNSREVMTQPELSKSLNEFRLKLSIFQQNKEGNIDELLAHPFSLGLFEFFKRFPIPYHEDHIHLTGSLTADFIYPRLMPLLEGPQKEIYLEKIKSVYGPQALPIKSVGDVDKLIRLKDDERFARYLKILYLPKLILTSRTAHRDAAYHLASELFLKYNVGSVRLKFTLSRSSSDESEQIPNLESITSEDVVLGLYEGFISFKNQHPQFDFILSPCFRKEPDFYDSAHFSSKKDHFIHQVNTLLELIDRHPFLQKYVCEVDTVGDERGLYRKDDFNELKIGFRKLQYRGFKVRSHHGETWKTLRLGIQAVDNAMNIWQIDTLEHGLSLGINPNYYFHSLLQRVLTWNSEGKGLMPNTPEFLEISEMLWNGNGHVAEKLIKGITLNAEEATLFTKAKFHTAREVEHYQHDVLNRMIHKEVSLVALPSSNKKLTDCFEDFKDHPFSWWEKKGVRLGVGTDNYVTLNTNYIQELLILLYTDPYDLKLTKLLMVATGETRRPYLSQLLWNMRKQL